MRPSSSSTRDRIYCIALRACFPQMAPMFSPPLFFDNVKCALRGKKERDGLGLPLENDNDVIFQPQAVAWFS